MEAADEGALPRIDPAEEEGDLPPDEFGQSLAR